MHETILTGLRTKSVYKIFKENLLNVVQNNVASDKGQTDS